VKIPAITGGQFDRFWLIWGPESDKPPGVVYGSRNQADQVASKLALQQPGRPFFVLGAEAGYIAEGVVKADARDPSPESAGGLPRARRETSPISRPGPTIRPE